MDSAQAAFVAAEELYRHKHFASAEQRYREAAGAGHAQQAWCHNRRGLCLSQCGRGAEALAAYDAALQAQPLDAMLRFNRGYRRRVLGHRDGARADLLLAAEMGGDSKWGRQARKLLQEHWGGEAAAAAPARADAPPTPLGQRKARGKRTVQQWLQEESASPSSLRTRWHVSARSLRRWARTRSSS